MRLVILSGKAAESSPERFRLALAWPVSDSHTPLRYCIGASAQQIPLQEYDVPQPCKAYNTRKRGQAELKSIPDTGSGSASIGIHKRQLSHLLDRPTSVTKELLPGLEPLPAAAVANPAFAK